MQCGELDAAARGLDSSDCAEAIFADESQCQQRQDQRLTDPLTIYNRHLCHLAGNTGQVYTKFPASYTQVSNVSTNSVNCQFHGRHPAPQPSAFAADPWLVAISR